MRRSASRVAGARRPCCMMLQPRNDGSRPKAASARPKPGASELSLLRALGSGDLVAALALVRGLARLLGRLGRHRGRRSALLRHRDASWAEWTGRAGLDASGAVLGQRNAALGAR